MHLSTSSSNDRLPKGSWIKVWLIVSVLFLAFVSYFEWDIRSSGWSPSVVDSPDLWVEQRKRASLLKDKALILVGASRMQLDVDMSVLKKRTKLEPIQLAIDGTSYIPVLESLANDESISGTIFVSVNAYNMNKGKDRDISVQWLNHYEKVNANELEPYRVINNRIRAFFNDSLVTRLEGAKPYTIISVLPFQKESVGNYLTTQTDRSRSADYKKVQMPQFYAARLQRHYGANLVNKSVTFKQLFKVYEDAIENIRPAANQGFSDNLNYLMTLVNKIESRGGEVVLIRFPTGKLIWELDNKKYPKEQFWNQIEKKHALSVNFIDYPSLNQFDLPDGSHLDYQDRPAFTRSLVDAIDKKRFGLYK